MKLKPICLLAYANTSQPDAHLSALAQERKGIRDALLENPHCQPNELSDAYLSDIEASFKTFGEDIVAFHFAGHGGSDQLELVTANGTLTPAFVQGLAEYISRYARLRMVVLNACATREQARVFHQQGVGIVIATHEPIQDAVAKDFAIHFYQHLASGSKVREAYDEATLQLRSRHQVNEYYRGGERDVMRMANKGLNPSEPYLLSIAEDQTGADQSGLQEWQDAYDDKPDQPIGKYAYLLCNRNKEINTFYDTLQEAFSQGRNQPHAFLIHGSSKELLQSLNERFRRFAIREVLDPEEKRISFHTRVWDIELPDSDDFKHPDEQIPHIRRNQALSNSFKIRADDISADMVLDRINRNKHVDVAFLCHYLLAEQWHPDMKAFLSDYINEFTQRSPGAEATTIILTFNVIYPPVKGFLDRFRPLEGKIGTALHEITKEATNCTLLNRLQDVPYGDVDKWQIKQRIQDALFTSRVFGKKKKLPMQQIEPELIAAIQRHNQRLL